jgi:RNA polymerase sigma-70 factor, ECF subfamily
MPVDAMTLFDAAETDARRIARGLGRKDMALLNQLVERYQYRLVRYLIYLTASRERVEDLAQETWLRVLNRGGQFDGRSRFESWLFSIARNLAIDDLRRRRIASLDDPESDGDGWADDLPAPDRASPFLAAAKSEDAVRLASALGGLASALGGLAPLYREVLMLRFQEELSLLEISAVVGAPVPTVSSRIHRGLELLRTSWEGGTNAV